MEAVKGKRARSRVAIMHAAKVLFEEKGINNVTFNDIAVQADMCRTTIFNHFPTINDLMLALAEQEIVDVTEHCKASGLEGRALIMDMFNMLLLDTANYPELTCNLLTNSIINTTEKRSVVKIEKLIHDNLEGMTEGEKKRKVVLLTGAYYGLIYHYLINDIEFEPRKMKREFSEMAKEIF